MITKQANNIEEETKESKMQDIISEEVSEQSNKNLKIYSWNINGIRVATKNGDLQNFLKLGIHYINRQNAIFRGPRNYMP